ncbi:MAG: hypothetical protein GY821_04475 [Gammaproteobacteria bacterium]|nr:hypothetical protein [Gammaproteobacteria bacterium]
MLENNAIRIIFCSLLLLLLSACNLPPQRQLNIKTYLFSLPTVQEKTTTSDKKLPTIKVNHISASPPFNSKLFIFKLKDANYQNDYYNRFLALPATQLQQIAIYKLKSSGNFSEVLGENSSQIANYAVTFTLRELYIDSTQTNRMTAVISIEAKVNKVSLANSKLLFFDHTYRQKMLIANYALGAQQAVLAWDKGITIIFNQFNADWAQARNQT